MLFIGVVAAAVVVVVVVVVVVIGLPCFYLSGFRVTPLRGICLVPTESNSATTKDSLLTTRLTHSNRAVAGTGGTGEAAAPGDKMNILNEKKIDFPPSTKAKRKLNKCYFF